MSAQTIALTDDFGSVRDSWDLLETPRTSHSETDELIIKEPKVNIQRSRRTLSEEYYEQKTDERIQKGSNSRFKSKDNKGRYESITNKRLPNFDGATVSTPSYSSSCYVSDTAARSRPVSANSFNSTPKVILKQYRKLRLRNHDDMLKEQIDKLRLLLDDSENMTEEELTRQHREQTANMIAVDGRGRILPNYYADYKELNGGARTKKIIISRSLPESIRPKSPFSSSASSLRSSRDSEQSDSYNFSLPRAAPSSKKVSFSESQKTKKSSISESRSPKPSAAAKSTAGSRQNRFKEASCRPIVSPPAEASYYSENSETEHLDNESLEQTKVAGDARLEQEGRRKYKPARCKQGNSKSGSNARRRDSMEASDLRSTQENVKYGTYEDVDGRKHSDNNLKRTANTDIKRWLRAKEREVRELKKERKLKEKEKLLMEEQQKQREEERKAESSKKLKEWQAAKRKQARLLRRQKLAKVKLEFQMLSNSTNDLTSGKAPKSTSDLTSGQTLEPEKPDQKQPTDTKPRAPTKQRPMSAPSSRRKLVKPKIPLEEVIKNNPDLQRRMNELEKQKKLKHRQSYDEWLKAKEREKKDVMKAVREQRAKLEKEISEETAKVISEAAKRRSENIRYKGSEATQAEKTHKESQKSPKAKASSDASAKGKACETKDEKFSDSRTSAGTPPRSTPVYPQAPRGFNMPKSGKPKVEDKIPETNANPYSDPFEPPKLRRPKSKLEQGGVNGPGFSRFIWDLVNEQENGMNRPEPQGADSPERSPEPNKSKKGGGMKVPSPPKQSASPTPPEKKPDVAEGVPIIESGRTIFSMTSIE